MITSGEVSDARDRLARLGPARFGPAPDGPTPLSVEPERWRAYQAACAEARDARAHVRLAIWCEGHGLQDQRREHLERAVALDPGDARARGLLGQVADRAGWSRAEEVIQRDRADADRWAILARYHARRDRAPETPEGQRTLALWCERAGLPPEAKAHWEAVRRLDPTDPEAWRRLGYVRHEGRWILADEVGAFEAERREQARADAEWLPRLRALSRRLADPAGRDAAISALSAIRDPRAVPAVVDVFGLGSPDEQTWAAWILSRIDSPAATHRLTLLAAFSESDRARRVALSGLAGRDPRTFLGLLINQLRTPIRYEVRERGRDGEPDLLLAEGADSVVHVAYEPPDIPPMPEFRRGDRIEYDRDGTRLLVRDQGLVHGPRGSIDRVEELYPIDRAEALSREAEEASRGRIAADVASIERYNAAVESQNGRVRSALVSLTGRDLGAEREPWASWWSDELGYAYISGRDRPPVPKPVSVVAATPIQPPPIPVDVRVTPIRSHCCLAAGTPVLTREGWRPIEAIRVGDQVLAQDPAGGGLDFRPVHAAVRCPPSPTLRVDLRHESLVATPIHRFWVAGRGWAMARDLRPGDRLRALDGLATVAAVEPAGERPTFNLEVSGHPDYFAGRLAILTHDNSPVAPTPEPFDAAPPPTPTAGATSGSR